MNTGFGILRQQRQGKTDHTFAASSRSYEYERSTFTKALPKRLWEELVVSKSSGTYVTPSGIVRKVCCNCHRSLHACLLGCRTKPAVLTLLCNALLKQFLLHVPSQTAVCTQVRTEGTRPLVAVACSANLPPCAPSANPKATSEQLRRQQATPGASFGPPQVANWLHIRPHQ